MTKRKQAGTLPAEPVAVQYMGGGYLPFIPARNMTAAEAAPHWATIKEAEANGQRLYTPAHEPEAKDGE